MTRPKSNLVGSKKQLASLAARALDRAFGKIGPKREAIRSRPSEKPASGIVRLNSML
jgi:hypothetical protein